MYTSPTGSRHHLTTSSFDPIVTCALPALSVTQTLKT
jgi:hypothetical protein